MYQNLFQTWESVFQKLGKFLEEFHSYNQFILEMLAQLNKVLYTVLWIDS